MTADLSARKFEILVYDGDTDPLDVSPIVESCTIANSQYDESGLILVSGSLVLHCHPYSPLGESFDPRLNSRWAIGNKVRVRIADDSGNLQLHPRGALRIVEQPIKPFAGNPKMTIELGCILKLKDRNMPAANNSGITLGTVTSRESLINSLAIAAGVPQLQAGSNISSWNIAVPVTRDSGSLVAQMGAIAFGAGYVLWIDNQERLFARRVEVNPTQLNFDWDVRSGLASYQALSSSEKPVEKIIATGTLRSAKPTIDPPDQTVFTNTSRFMPADITTIRLRGLGTANTISTKSSVQAAGLVVPENGANNGALIPASFEVTSRVYAGGISDIAIGSSFSAGFLLNEEVISYLPANKAIPRIYSGNPTLIPAQRVITRYEYDRSCVVKVEKSTYLCRENVQPDLAFLSDADSSNNSPEQLVISAIEVQTWVPVSNGWQYTKSASSFITDSSGASSTSSYSATANQPPAPEQKEASFYESEGNAHAIHELSFFGSQGRSRSYSIPYVSTQDQLAYMAALLGKILYGRNYGVSLTTGLEDAWIDGYTPLMAADITDRDFVTNEVVKSRYLIDGDSFALTQSAQTIACDGIYLGRVSSSGSSTHLDTGYSEALSFAGANGVIVGVGGSFVAYGYSLDGGSQSLGTAIVLAGGTLSEIANGWNTLSESGWNGLSETDWNTLGA